MNSNTENLKEFISNIPIINKEDRPCLHRQCPECKGTGRKGNGMICIHMISCPCSRCNQHWLEY